MNPETRNKAMYDAGRAAAIALQGKSSTMDGTKLNAATGDIPDFQSAKSVQNMLNRRAGKKDGFVCRSSAGRVVRLIQAYDSDTYPDEPEDLPAHWGFVWSHDPAHALPFISLATSPFMTGDVCSVGGAVYRSNRDNNVWSPETNPEFWEDATAPEEPEDPGDEYEEWVQPTGAHDAYHYGDIRTHKGKTWRSTVDNNTWEPGVYGWEEVE